MFVEFCNFLRNIYLIWTTSYLWLSSYFVGIDFIHIWIYHCSLIAFHFFLRSVDNLSCWFVLYWIIWHVCIRSNWLCRIWQVCISIWKSWLSSLLFFFLFYFFHMFSLKFFKFFILFSFLFFFPFLLIPSANTALSMDILFNIFNIFIALSTLKCFWCTNIKVFIILKKIYYFLAKLALLWLHFTILFVCFVLELLRWKITVWALNNLMPVGIVIVFLSFRYAHLALLTLVVLPGTANVVHSKLGNFNLLFTQRTLLSFNDFFHFDKIG